MNCKDRSCLFLVDSTAACLRGMIDVLKQPFRQVSSFLRKKTQEDDRSCKRKYFLDSKISTGTRNVHDRSADGLWTYGEKVLDSSRHSEGRMTVVNSKFRMEEYVE